MHRGVPDHPEHEMSGGNRMRNSSILTGISVFLLAVAGCLQSDPGADGGSASGSGIQDPDLLAGATSSTNWPQEDVGFHPIQIFGTVDSTLVFAFKQKLETGDLFRTVQVSGTVRLYRAGYIPVFDSVPFIQLNLAMTDTFRISADDLNPLFPKDMDTLRFTVEFRSDTALAIAPGFAYSRKLGKFVELPSAPSEQYSIFMVNPHYKVAGFPDSAFQAELSDSSGDVSFYYYIPGAPYFWRHSMSGDSLYIGPTVKGNFPLRCVRILSHVDPNTGFTVDVFPLSSVKEIVNDSLHHSVSIQRLKLGSPILRISRQGTLPIRSP
jgi:hypothetical protein